MDHSNYSDTSDWWTSEDLAGLAGVTAAAVRRWIRRGDLAAHRATPTSPYRIPHEAARELLQRLGREVPDA